MGREAREIPLIPEEYSTIDEWVATCKQYGRPIIRTTEKYIYLICYDKGKVKGIRLKAPPEIIQEVKETRRGKKTKKFFELYEKLKEKIRVPVVKKPKVLRGRELAEALYSLVAQLPEELRYRYELPRGVEVEEYMRRMAPEMISDISRRYGTLAHILRPPEGWMYSWLKNADVITDEVDRIFKEHESQIKLPIEAVRDRLFDIYRKLQRKWELSSEDIEILQKAISFVNKLSAYEDMYERIRNTLEEYSRMVENVKSALTTRPLQEIIKRVELEDDFKETLSNIEKTIGQIRYHELKWHEGKRLLERHVSQLNNLVSTIEEKSKEVYPTVKEDTLRRLTTMETYPYQCEEVFKELGLVEPILENLDNPHRVIERPPRVRNKFYQEYFINRLWNKDLKSFFRKCIDTYAVPLAKAVKERGIYDELREVLLKEFHKNSLEELRAIATSIEKGIGFRIKSTRRISYLNYEPKGIEEQLRKSREVLSCKDVDRLEELVPRIKGGWYRRRAEYLAKYLKDLCSKFPDSRVYYDGRDFFFTRPSWRYFKIEIRREYGDLIKELLKLE